MAISIATPKSSSRARIAPPSLMTAIAVWSERRALARMDVSRLKDMGISPQDAATEAARPFWDLPVRTRR